MIHFNRQGFSISPRSFTKFKRSGDCSIEAANSSRNEANFGVHQGYRSPGSQLKCCKVIAHGGFIWFKIYEVHRQAIQISTNDPGQLVQLTYFCELESLETTTVPWWLLPRRPRRASPMSWSIGMMTFPVEEYKSCSKPPTSQ